MPPSRDRSESPQEKVEDRKCHPASGAPGYLPSVFLSEEHSERESIPNEIERAAKHDRREAEGRVTAFTFLAECFSEHHESTRYRGRHNNEDKIPHLVLCRVCLPGPPRPTQRSATSANGVIRSVPARPRNRRRWTAALIAPALRVHAAIAIAAKYVTPTA